ncbi:calcium incorporation protein MxaA [Paraburkholderia kirstenboschensis]|uniref:Calcium incorporation protein MxaA n=1 Tax=Paraburkholderia kirstenboschensis TaxID=1245436 RepID=A0ABZ0EEL4_9BURK|nr:calcium incorporation protein MxaA [Paraburkholderia kirstenboschensis]WOD15360.1 calcium incorporation protein MxaA [Paraburkholderia kirstenboschensis]
MRADGLTRRIPAALMLAVSLMPALMPSTNIAAASGAAFQPTVQEPRAFGYLLGDVLTQRILVKDGGYDIGTVTPPSLGRTDAWLERRRVRSETDADGRRWMAIDYQVVNVPTTLMQIALPALSLTSSSGATLQVGEWPLSIGPATPANPFNAGDLQAVRPDRQAPAVPTAPLRRQAGFALGLLMLSLLSWAGWWLWRNARESARLPFARAWRELRRMQPKPRASEPSADASAQAWLCLHRALNETAGHVVHAGALSGLFVRAPYLLPLRAQLEQFYRQSAERFFTPASSGDAYPVRTLCEALYRAEQRHQR